MRLKGWKATQNITLDLSTFFCGTLGTRVVGFLNFIGALLGQCKRWTLSA